MRQLKLLHFVFAVSLVYTSSAQMMPRHAISSGSGNFESVTAHISWTIGQSEPVTTIYQPTVILHGGFQQFVEFPVSVAENKRDSEILLYPNPCNAYIILDIKLDYTASLSYRLYDFSGKLLLSKEIQSESNNFREIIDLEDYSHGVYNLLLFTENGFNCSIESLKLIKN